MNKLLRLISRLTHPHRRWATVLTVTIGALTIIGLVFSCLPIAHAATDTPWWKPFLDLYSTGSNIIFNINLFSPVNGTVMKETFGGIMGLISGLALFLGNFCMGIIGDIILPGQSSILFSKEVHTAWSSIMQIANLLFFVALFVFSIMVITRQAGYNFKKAITALIVAAAMANLSYYIAQVIVEIGDALRNSVAILPGLNLGTDPGSWTDWFRLWDAAANASYDITESVGRYAFVTTMLAAQQVLIAYAMFRVAILLIERTVRIVLLTIFAPVQAALSILPVKELQSLGSSWIGELIKWTLVLPLTLILVSIAHLFMKVSVTAPQSLSNLYKGIYPADPTTIIFPLAAIAVLIAATEVPKLLNVPISAITKNIMGAPAQVTGQVGQAAWKATSGAVRAGVGTYLATYGEKLKAGNSPVGLTYRWLSDAKFRAGSRLATLQKANEAIGAVRRLGPSERTYEATEASFKEHVAQAWANRTNSALAPGAPPVSATDYDELSDLDKDAAKKQYSKLHPQEALENVAASRARKVALAERVKLAEDIGYPLEAVRGQLDELFARAEHESATGGVTEETGDEIRQMFGYALKQANSRGVGSMGWKIMMTDLQDNKQRMDFLTNYRDKAGLGFAFSIPEYDVTAKDRQQYTQARLERQIGNAYADFAQSNKDLTESQSNITRNASTLNRATGNTQLADHIRLASTDTLRVILEDRVRAALISSANDLQALNSNKSARTGVNAILSRTDISQKDKATAIQNILTAQVRNPKTGNLLTDKEADALTQTLTSGINTNNKPELDRAQAIAAGFDSATPAIKNAVRAQVRQVRRYRTAEPKRAAAQTRIDKLDSGDSYDNATAAYATSPAAGQALATRINGLIEQVNRSFAADPAAKISNKVESVTAIDAAKLAQLVKDLRIETIKPGTANIGDEIGFKQNMTIEETLTMLNRALKGARKIK